MSCGLFLPLSCSQTSVYTNHCAIIVQGKVELIINIMWCLTAVKSPVPLCGYLNFCVINRTYGFLMDPGYFRLDLWRVFCAGVLFYFKISQLAGNPSETLWSEWCMINLCDAFLYSFILSSNCANTLFYLYRAQEHENLNPLVYPDDIIWQLWTAIHFIAFKSCGHVEWWIDLKVG